MPTSLTYCLHQILAMQGITKPIKNAVRAVAFLLEEMESYAMVELIRDTVNIQLSTLAEDMQLLTTDVREKIDNNLGDKITDLDKNMDRINRVIDKLEKAGTNALSAGRGGNPAQANYTQGTRTYAEALITPPPHADPKLAAKEGIRARQHMLEGIGEDSKLRGMDDMQIKDELNKITRELGLEGRGIRTVTRQRLGGLLIEMADDHVARWMKEETNVKRFCEAVGTNVTFRKRIYNLIAYNVPITMEPENDNHIKEIHETNQLEPRTIKVARWVKPIARRSITQRTAHLILSYTDIHAANRALANGLSICHRRVTIEKIRKEPIRCLKCQQWNHYAKECIADHDTCGNCAEHHRTNQCQDHTKKRCASCNSTDHASWSRECPIFRRKVDECNKRNPENGLQFFPSDEPWTWTPRRDDNAGKSRQEYPDTNTSRRQPNGNENCEPEGAHRNRDVQEPTAWGDTWAGNNYNDFYV